MELRDYLHVILKRLWLIVLGAIFGLAIGIIASRLMGQFSQYSATATVLVGGDVATVEQNSSYTMLGDQFLGTYADLATRSTVLQAVIDQLGLTTTPDDLANSISAETVEGTQLLEISATDDNAERSAAIANAVARQLVAMPSLRVRNFVVLVEEAEVPASPNHGWVLIVVASTILGVLLVGGLAFLVEFVSDPVYSPGELAQRANLQVLATVRPAPGWRNRISWRTPVWRKVSQVAWWPLTQVCQQRFREVKVPTNPHPRPLCILVTNPTGGQDKAVVATNLATTWAKTGRRVVVIDADMRSPSLHKWFSVSRQPGLADLLSAPPQGKRGCAEEVKLAEHSDLPHESAGGEWNHDVLQPTSVPCLTVLAAGKADNSSKHMLASGELPFRFLGKVVDELATQADVIVVNGPPLLTSSEGTMMAAQAHGVVLTLRAGQTKMDAADDSREALEMAQAQLWATVLTEVG